MTNKVYHLMSTAAGFGMLKKMLKNCRRILTFILEASLIEYADPAVLLSKLPASNPECASCLTIYMITLQYNTVENGKNFFSFQLIFTLIT